MEISNRKSIFDELKKYDILSNGDNDYIEITEWSNGEGYDVQINTKWKNQSFSLTHGELEAINYLIKVLDYGNSEES